MMKMTPEERAEARAEAARLKARRERVAGLKAVRLATLHANVLTRSEQYFKRTERPAGYKTATDILREKRESEQWHQVGICATAGGDRFPIYLPAAAQPVQAASASGVVGARQ